MIREYKSEDYKMLASWWKSTKEVVPNKEMIPTTTFILERKKVPIVSLGVILTNCKEVAYLANFISNPEIKDKGDASDELLHFVLNYAKKLGYKRVLAFAYQEKLKTRFRELGMTPTLNNLEAFVME